MMPLALDGEKCLLNTCDSSEKVDMHSSSMQYCYSFKSLKGSSAKVLANRLITFVHGFSFAFKRVIRGRFKSPLQVFGVVQPQNVNAFTLATPRATFEAKSAIFQGSKAPQIVEIPTVHQLWRNPASEGEPAEFRVTRLRD